MPGGEISKKCKIPSHTYLSTLNNSKKTTKLYNKRCDGINTPDLRREGSKPQAARAVPEHWFRSTCGPLWHQKADFEAPVVHFGPEDSYSFGFWPKVDHRCFEINFLVQSGPQVLRNRSGPNWTKCVVLGYFLVQSGPTVLEIAFWCRSGSLGPCFLHALGREY